MEILFFDNIASRYVENYVVSRMITTKSFFDLNAFIDINFIFEIAERRITEESEEKSKLRF